MDMRVYSTRHNELARGIYDFSIWMLEILSNLGNRFPINENIRFKCFGIGNEGAFFYESSHSLFQMFQKYQRFRGYFRPRDSINLFSFDVLPYHPSSFGAFGSYGASGSLIPNNAINTSGGISTSSRSLLYSCSFSARSRSDRHKTCRSSLSTTRSLSVFALSRYSPVVYKNVMRFHLSAGMVCFNFSISPIWIL